MRRRAAILTTFCICLSANVAFAALESTTGNMIWGSGNQNGGFTIDRNADLGIELALRAKVRYPSPSDAPGTGIRHLGGNTYGYFAATGHGAGNVRASWNVDWSIDSNFNGNGGFLDTLTYTFERDYDPGWGTSFEPAYFSYDLINTFYADHSFGDKTVGSGLGTEAADADEYAALIKSSSLAQNSTNLAFDFPSSPFDPTADGRYTFRLTAYDNGVEVAQSVIHVMVGNGVVPEPASLLAWGGIICCVGLVRRRRLG